MVYSLFSVTFTNVRTIFCYGIISVAIYSTMVYVLVLRYSPELNNLVQTLSKVYCIKCQNLVVIQTLCFPKMVRQLHASYLFGVFPIVLGTCRLGLTGIGDFTIHGSEYTVANR